MTIRLIASRADQLKPRQFSICHPRCTERDTIRRRCGATLLFDFLRGGRLVAS